MGAAAGLMRAADSPEQLIEAGHWKRARELVEARIREEPNDPQANFLLSQIRNAFGDYTSPLPLAEKAVALDRGTARYHRQLAEVLGITAQHAGVFQQLLLARRFRREIDAALALDEQDVQAWRDLMEFYLLAPGIAGGDRAKARATADRIMAIDTAEGYLARARIAAFQKQGGEIEGLLRRAVAAQPGNYRARIALAQYYLDPGHPNAEGAEEQARKAVQLDSGRAEAYAVLASVYADRGDWTQLDALLASAAAESPEDRIAYYRAAERLLAAGRERQRAARYLRLYLAQPQEGNEPSAADASARLALAGRAGQ